MRAQRINTEQRPSTLLGAPRARVEGRRNGEKFDQISPFPRVKSVSSAPSVSSTMLDSTSTLRRTIVSIAVILLLGPGVAGTVWAQSSLDKAQSKPFDTAQGSSFDNAQGRPDGEQVFIGITSRSPWRTGCQA